MEASFKNEIILYPIQICTVLNTINSSTKSFIVCIQIFIVVDSIGFQTILMNLACVSF